MHVCVCVRLHARVCTVVYACTCLCVHTCMCVSSACICTRVCACMRVCVRVCEAGNIARFAKTWPGCAKLLHIVVSLSKKLYSHCSSPSSCLVLLSGIRVVVEL